jgi:hypothetical protein
MARCVLSGHSCCVIIFDDALFLTVLFFSSSTSTKSQGHCQFEWPWTTLVAFKDANTKKRWYRSAAETDLEIRKRILPTKSGRPALRNYDGATHYSYQLPPKSFETSHCRQEEMPEECAMLKNTDKFVHVDDDDDNNDDVYNPVIERRLNH